MRAAVRRQQTAKEMKTNKQINKQTKNKNKDNAQRARRANNARDEAAADGLGFRV